MSEGDPLTLTPARWPRLRSVVFAMALVALIAAPIAAAGFAIARADRAVSPLPVPVWAPVRAASDRTTAPGGLLLRWSPSPDLVAPAWTGLVQEVLLHPGQVIASGTPVVRIDGVVRLAVRTDRPISRPLEPGDDSEEVRVLNAGLRSLGLPSGDGTIYNGATDSGVAGLGARIGVAEPTGFDPAWFVYLPSDGLTIDTVALAVASPAPSSGTRIAATLPALVGARAYGSDRFRQITEASAPDGSTAASGGDTSDSGAVSDPLKAVALDPPPSDVEPGTTVQVGETDVGALGDQGELGGPAFVAIAQKVKHGAPVLAVTLVSDTRAGGVQVPTAALITGDDAMCVLARKPGAASGRLRLVDVVDSFLGTSVVQGVEPAWEVAVRPARLDRLGCGRR